MSTQLLEGKPAVPGQYITPLYRQKNEDVEEFISGRGTTVSEIEHNGKIVPIIVATVLGRIVFKTIETNKIIVSVLNKKYFDDSMDSAAMNSLDLSPVSNNLPKENDIVLVRITKLNKIQAFCEIISVESRGNVLQDSGIGSSGEVSHESIPPGGTGQILNNQSTLASSLTTGVNAMATELGESFKGIIRSQDIRLTERDKVKVIESFKPGDIVRAIIISLGDGSNYYLSTARNELGVIYAKSENGAGYPMFPIDWEHMVCPKTGVIEKRKCAKPIT